MSETWVSILPAARSQKLQSSSQAVGEPPGERQPESVAAVYAADPGVGLLEWLEQIRVPIGSDADAGIDASIDHGSSAPRESSQGDRDALASESVGIADEIDEDRRIESDR